MSATPIPRTLTMTIYGDMDLSIIKEKPKSRKEVKTYSKLESKIDEILSTFLVHSEIRKNIKKIKKQKKIFNNSYQKKILENLNFKLTSDQEKTLNEINNDLQSDQKMFRLLQGDVGSGKTIVALCAAANTVKSGFQVAVMAPTEILARQHYNLAKEIFDKNLNLEILSSKSEYKEKKIIKEKLENNHIDVIFGTHAIFQKKNNF